MPPPFGGNVMVRLLLCLPICLLLAPAYLPSSAVSEEGPAQAIVQKGGPAPKPELAPLTFLENWLKEYDAKVQGYTCIFRKRERIDNKLHELEIIDVAYREKPLGVFFNWKQA